MQGALQLEAVHAQCQILGSAGQPGQAEIPVASRQGCWTAAGGSCWLQATGYCGGGTFVPNACSMANKVSTRVGNITLAHLELDLCHVHI